jgi:hypothetical protein
MESESDNDVKVKPEKEKSAGMMDNLEGIIPSGIIVSLFHIISLVLS